jgi:DNA invertase Pin-like site-specific DNA recombinase
MGGILIGYARCSTSEQDLTAQREALAGMGVAADRVYVDHGLTGTNRERPGLREALAACRSGDTLVVTKLDRLARSVPEPAASSTSSPVAASACSSGGRPRPDGPRRPAAVNVLAMVAEFERDLIVARTREGMAVAKAKGRLRGKQPKLTTKQEAHLVALHREGKHTGMELAELFNVARSTVYRAVERAGASSK